MLYEVTVKGCISINGRKFIGGSRYQEKELGDVRKLKGLVVKVEEEGLNMSIKDLKEFSQDLNVSELETLLEDEKKGEARKGAIEFLEGRIKELKDV